MATATRHNSFEALIAGRRYLDSQVKLDELVEGYKARVRSCAHMTDQCGRHQTPRALPQLCDDDYRFARIVSSGFNFEDGLEDVFCWTRQDPDGYPFNYPREVELVIVEDGDGLEASTPLRPFSYLHDMGMGQDEVEFRLTPKPGLVRVTADFTSVTYDVEAL